MTVSETDWFRAGAALDMTRPMKNITRPEKGQLDTNLPSQCGNTCKLISNMGQSSSGRKKCFLLFTTYTILAIIIIELVLINPSLRPVEAGKKKKIIKKIKEILPLIALLKRKKIVLLPIPM